jgi:hypothetical protein
MLAYGGFLTRERLRAPGQQRAARSVTPAVPAPKKRIGAAKPTSLPGCS